jgi:hypothetical protein
VAPNLTRLSLSGSFDDAEDATLEPPVLAPGAWPRLKSLSLPGGGYFNDPGNARNALASLFLACGSRLCSLDMESGSAKPQVLVELLAVIADEVRRCVIYDLFCCTRGTHYLPTQTQTVPIPWRASLRSLFLPSVADSTLQGPIVAATKEGKSWMQRGGGSV